MLGIISHVKHPAFNLAAEEYFLKELKDDIFFLYINKPSIIVGKHQNALAEIDLNYTQKHNIPVYRRMSGGGTVYHDEGNLNFCFITNEKEGNLIDFDKHSTPIVKALESLGLNVLVGKRHDLSIEGKKITGTASHVYKQRAMHHGTLLFNADLTVLNSCLSDNYNRYGGKGVKSVRSTVTLISDHLTRQMTMQEFTDHIFNFLISYFPNAETYQFTDNEKKEINKLVNDKYEKWEWNYGYSPVYEIERTLHIRDKKVSSRIKVEKGMITDLKLTSDDPSLKIFLKEFSSVLLNTQHSNISIKNRIPRNNLLNEEQILSLFF